MSEANEKHYRQFLVNSICSELQKALDQATGAQWNVSESEKPGAGLAATPPVLYRLVLKGDLDGASYLQFVPEEAKSLGAQISQKPPAADPILAMLENAVTELMLALISEYGEVEVSVETASELDAGEMEVVPLRASGGSSVVSIVVYIDAKLVQSLKAKVQVEAASDAAESSAPTMQSMQAISQKTGIDESKLKLILDVELNLLLRFGQRHLTLREILDLNSGSVIELDRQVDEPIELLLDGRVIARGEAVVVDGNYGLRVTEVPQPMASQLTQ